MIITLIHLYYLKEHYLFSMGQNDSIEFLWILLNDLREENNLVISLIEYIEYEPSKKIILDMGLEFHEFYSKTDKSFKNDIFDIQICSVCLYDSYRFQKIMIYLYIY